jgi:dolichyl-phosphate-mannose--protein O-mannosyl transferase
MQSTRAERGVGGRALCGTMHWLDFWYVRFRYAAVMDKQCFWYNYLTCYLLAFFVACNACKLIYPRLVLNKNFRS